mgnify:CR=1 FL=1
MINIIKRLVSYIIIQIRYWNKLKFPISARIGMRGVFFQVVWDMDRI